MTEKLNAWGGRIRPVSDSISNPEFFRDPPREIARLMGGRQFFFEIGAKWIHRVGQFKGIGWCLPYSGASRDINYIKITLSEAGDSFDMLFGKVNERSSHIPSSVEEIESVKAVKPSEIHATYQRVTIDG